MTKTKICGITNFVDGSLAAQLGAWAIGFVFYPNSPRYILPENAAQITRQLANYPVKTIGVFVNETPERINSIAAKVRLDYVQLHGTEPEIACRKIERPYIKNIRSIEELAFLRLFWRFRLSNRRPRHRKLGWHRQISRLAARQANQIPKQAAYALWRIIYRKYRRRNRPDTPRFFGHIQQHRDKTRRKKSPPNATTFCQIKRKIL